MTTISASMIVKNEEAVLEDCLHSLEGIDEIVILDTGSTDRTGEIARKYTSKYYANEYQWKDDFAEARSTAQRKCTSDFILIIDADERLEPGGIEKIRKYLATVSPEIEVIDITCVSAGRGDVHHQPRLYRNKPDEIYWCAPIHNYLSKLGQTLLDVKITYGYSPTHKKDPDRALRILKRRVTEHPNTLKREVFYLAREYMYRKDWITALYWYEDYLKRGDWAPEMAEAYLQMAQCLFRLQRGDDARTACMQAIRLNADFREALEFMASMCGPINREQWLKYATLAENRNLLFMRVKEEKKADYYDRHYSVKQSTARYDEIYERVGEWCKGKCVLDIGCGTAPLQKYVKDYHGFDFSEKAVKAANHACVRVADAYDSIPYQGDYTTYVTLEVLEHLQDLLVIRNIPTGKEFIFSVPSFSDPAHLRTYTEESMRIRFGQLLEIQEVVRLNLAAGRWTKFGPKTSDHILLVRSRKK